MDAWVNEYIGIPFLEHGRTMLGADCWGLIWLVYERVFNIELPSYVDDYETTKDGNGIQAIADSESEKWTAISGDSIRVGDIAVFAIGGYNSHVGIIVSDELMLHIEQNLDSVIEKFKSPRWGNRLRAFYRHKDMA